MVCTVILKQESERNLSVISWDLKERTPRSCLGSCLLVLYTLGGYVKKIQGAQNSNLSVHPLFQMFGKLSLINSHILTFKRLVKQQKIVPQCGKNLEKINKNHIVCNCIFKGLNYCLSIWNSIFKRQLEMDYEICIMISTICTLLSFCYYNGYYLHWNWSQVLSFSLVSDYTVFYSIKSSCFTLFT